MLSFGVFVFVALDMLLKKQRDAGGLSRRDAYVTSL